MSCAAVSAGVFPASLFKSLPCSLSGEGLGMLTSDGPFCSTELCRFLGKRPDPYSSPSSSTGIAQGLCYTVRSGQRRSCTEAGRKNMLGSRQNCSKKYRGKGTEPVAKGNCSSVCIASLSFCMIIHHFSGEYPFSSCSESDYWGLWSSCLFCLPFPLCDLSSDS